MYSLQLISSSSQWYDKLRAEIKYFEDINIDIDKLMIQSREADKIRGQMAVLERRVQVSFLFYFFGKRKPYTTLIHSIIILIIIPLTGH